MGEKAGSRAANWPTQGNSDVPAAFNLGELRLAALGRREALPAMIGLVSVAVSMLFLYTSFIPAGDPRPFLIWLALTSAITIASFGLAIAFFVRQPGDREIVRIWLPVGRMLRSALNLATIISPWLLLPDAEPALWAIIMMMYLWFRATEVLATVDPHSQVWVALAGLPASLALYLVLHHAPYALPLTVFFGLASVSLFYMHRIVRRAALASIDHAATMPLPNPSAMAPPILPTAPIIDMPAAMPPGRLTRRQIEVLGLLCEGRSNKEIARELGVAPGTVKTHIEQTLAAMGAANRTDAAVKARTLGLV